MTSPLSHILPVYLSLNKHGTPDKSSEFGQPRYNLSLHTGLILENWARDLFLTSCNVMIYLSKLYSLLPEVLKT